MREGDVAPDARDLRDKIAFAEDRRDQRARAEGSFDQYMAQAREEFGVGSLKELEAEVRRLDREVEDAADGYADEDEAFMGRHGERLREWRDGR